MFDSILNTSLTLDVRMNIYESTSFKTLHYILRYLRPSYESYEQWNSVPSNSGCCEIFSRIFLYKNGNNSTKVIWDKVFKNKPGHICWRQPLKYLKWYGQTPFLPIYFIKLQTLNSFKFFLIFFQAFSAIISKVVSRCQNSPQIISKNWID